MSEDEDDSTKDKWSLDQESLDRLLAWLDPDRELAGRRLEGIIARLIKIFVRRGCHVAEELADKTVDRVARRLPSIQKDYVGDPALYFYGVAAKVFQEWVRPKPPVPPVPVPDPPEVLELYDQCLTSCLDLLSKRDRAFILGYFKEEGRAKIESHNAMAKELNLSINALRTKAYRLKRRLKECVLEYINRRKD